MTAKGDFASAATGKVVVAEPQAALRERLMRFVGDVGIPVRFETLSNTLLPGLDVRHGALCIDRDRWLYPGDLLHEAGHFAVAAPRERAPARLDPDGGDELTAIAWSYAATIDLGIAAEVVFHVDGYRGGAAALIDNFAAGRYIGVPLLHTYGMAIDPRQARSGGPRPYPHMLRWLR